MPHPVTASNSSFKIAQRFIVNTIISQQDFPFSGDQQTNKISRLISSHWKYSVGGSKHNHRKCFSLVLISICWTKFLICYLQRVGLFACLFVWDVRVPSFCIFYILLYFSLQISHLFPELISVLGNFAPHPKKRKKEKKKSQLLTDTKIWLTPIPSSTEYSILLAYDLLPMYQSLSCTKCSATVVHGSNRYKLWYVSSLFMEQSLSLQDLLKDLNFC